MRWCIVLVAFLGLQTHGLAQTTDEFDSRVPTLSFSPAEGRSGSTVTASGKGYCGSVTLRWDDETSVLNSGDADPHGNISIHFTVPESEPGWHTVTSTSRCGGTTASFKVVTTNPTSTTTTSPSTTTNPPPTTTTPATPTTTLPPPTVSELGTPPPTPGALAPTPGVLPQAPDGVLDSHKDSTLAQYEDIVKRELESGVILYNPPEQMRAGVVDRVEVRIAREESDDLAEGLEGRADPRVEQLLVGTTMRAKLEGSAFDTILIGSDLQYLAPKGFREWRWDAIPTDSGNHPLFFTVSVLHEKYYPNPIEEKVFERRIDVTVNPGYSLLKWVPNNWEKLVAALVGIIGIIIEGYRRLRLKRVVNQSGSIALGRGRRLKHILGQRRARNRP